MPFLLHIGFSRTPPYIASSSTLYFISQISPPCQVILWRKDSLYRFCTAEEHTPDFVWAMDSGLRAVWGQHRLVKKEFQSVLERYAEIRLATPDGRTECETFFKRPPITVFLRRIGGTDQVYCVTTLHTPGSVGPEYTEQVGAIGTCFDFTSCPLTALKTRLNTLNKAMHITRRKTKVHIKPHIPF